MYYFFQRYDFIPLCVFRCNVLDNVIFFCNIDVSMLLLFEHWFEGVKSIKLFFQKYDDSFWNAVFLNDYYRMRKKPLVVQAYPLKDYKNSFNCIVNLLYYVHRKKEQ